jgi:rubrerythrin
MTKMNRADALASMKFIVRAIAERKDDMIADGSQQRMDGMPVMVCRYCGIVVRDDRVDDICRNAHCVAKLSRDVVKFLNKHEGQGDGRKA